jgi:hypothetical protein
LWIGEQYGYSQNQHQIPYQGQRRKEGDSFACLGEELISNKIQIRRREIPKLKLMKPTEHKVASFIYLVGDNRLIDATQL